MGRAEPSVDLPLKIGDVAKLAELSIDAVRFYEREGLLGRVQRSRAGQRQYDDESVRRLAFVRRATALGFSLAEVKGLLGLRIAAGKPCDRVRERARGKLADIDRRIAELGAMRNALGRSSRVARTHARQGRARSSMSSRSHSTRVERHALPWLPSRRTRQVT
jgi:DNA-binding transcriptional MerR regulator